MSVSIKNIAGRSYMPISNNGVFNDVFESLNDLDMEIRASDNLKEQTEKMRKDWIANITLTTILHIYNRNFSSC